MARSSIVFVFNLLQDVNICRSLVYLARREFDVEIVFLVTHKFIERDRQSIWQRELSQMSADVGAGMFIFETALNAFAILQSRSGLIIAASESSLSGHIETHNLYKIAPPSFVRITVQHGFECVGFLQNREHNLAHGRNVTFAADIICGWCEAPALTAMVVSQRSKLYVSGPPTVLQTSVRDNKHPGVSGGIVCENLHSVRLRATGDFGTPFLETFYAFCNTFGDYGLPVTLRPHPGGQFAIKKNIELPSNVSLNNLPMYRADLPSYQFGISAPSTVLIDMLLAGIPTAVWHDEDGIMDYGNYEGLTEISGLSDWLAFARDSVVRPEPLLARQSQFLQRLAMPTDPNEVYGRFARLLATGAGGTRITAPIETFKRRRVLFIANGMIPTLQLSFLEPLKPLVASGEIIAGVITEQELRDIYPDDELYSDRAAKGFAKKIRDFCPDLIVCCRYSGPHAETITDVAAEIDAAVVYHIDDDLLNIPPEIGKRKFHSYNRPFRMVTTDHLLQHADLIYCSTKGLKKRFRELGYSTQMIAGEIYCSGAVRSPAEMRPVTTIGYMGFDHAHDFELVLPSLMEFMRRNEDARFELFGSIPLPSVLREFGDRVVTLPPVAGYKEFMEAFAARKWDIGLCPLVHSPFNLVKANTKWVEYTSVGIAVIATANTVYDDCCADGCGILVGDEWLEALELLTQNPDARYQMVERAQARLAASYYPERLREQILSIFRQAVDISEEKREQKEWMPKGVLNAYVKSASKIMAGDPGDALKRWKR